MNEGFIKLTRTLKDKAFYSKDSEKVHLWIHLLLNANWTDREEMLGGKPILCKAGQFTTGRKQLSMATGINESKIERLLTYFEKIEQQIEQQKTSTNRLISICNWSKYQSSEQQNEQQVNNDRTTSEQRVNTLKEVKERKKEKEINTLGWKNNFETYKESLRVEYLKLTKDKEWISQQQKFNPNVDILLTIDKACVQFWSTDAGWKNKKKSKTVDINWKSTLENAISQSMNRVYIPKEMQVQIKNNTVNSYD